MRLIFHPVSDLSGFRTIGIIAKVIGVSFNYFKKISGICGHTAAIYFY